MDQSKFNDKDRYNPGSRNSSSQYTSKIIKAGALIVDTKVFFSSWNPNASVEENLRQIRQQNLLGKSSRSRAEDILAIFRQRYLNDKYLAPVLAALTKKQVNGATLDRVFYFHTVQADPLLRDVVIKILVPKWSQGSLVVGSRELQQELYQWVKEGKMAGSWGENTIMRVAQGVLSTLRDFGILEGAVKKRIAPAYLSIQAFAYIAFYLKQHSASGSKLLDSEDWKLFFLDSEGVERLLVEAHQQGLLEYHVAGSVTRLTFPAESLEEYIDVLA